MRKIISFILISFLFIACKEEILPKPTGYLSLRYPANSYQKLDIERPYTFEISTLANAKNQQKKWLKIHYPALKASIDITYRPVEQNLRELLIEAEKLVYEHAVKAEEITTKNFENLNKKVYGSVQEILGNAASQIQFHVTDSTQHFIKGALYFYTKPNYDSILPAVAYIKKDITHLIETLEWK
ncbi:MAG: gliding motility lipoprotein GldD [Flavobacteriaceae bacterium]|nr:gliding motility lipoprotein GldD [Flavobacteriaceae bacterium]